MPAPPPTPCTDSCTAVPAPSPAYALHAGNTYCCPPGTAAYGDGSACRTDNNDGTHSNYCTLYGNPSLPVCTTVTWQAVSYTHLTLPTICSV